MIRRLFADPSMPPVTILGIDRPPRLDEVKGWTGGGFEIVRLNCAEHPPGTQMIVHDDGHPLRLPINRAATALYQETAARNGHPGVTDEIAGDVVILTGRHRMD